jgi:hypothetical protein
MDSLGNMGNPRDEQPSQTGFSIQPIAPKRKKRYYWLQAKSKQSKNQWKAVT